MLQRIFKFIMLPIVIAVVGIYLFWPENWAVRGPILDFLTGKQIGAPATAVLKDRFKLPPGFRIGVFARDVNSARMMRVTDAGDVLVSSMRRGEVVLLHSDKDNDGIADGRTVLLSGLDLPHGLALKDGYLYVAETGRIIRVPFDAIARQVGAVDVIFDRLPPGGNHRTRTIGFGPDGWLYVTVGSTCNVCIEDHPFRAAMLRMRADGTEAGVYATGLRNTVGFDWQPGTGRLYGTDNGRDLLGDDIPHCEINLIEEGQFYGWPLTFDNHAVDPDFGIGRETEIAASRIMEHGLGAHVAPLGIHFLNPQLAPGAYSTAALVALHGSWNRSELSGYKIVALHFAADGSINEEDFLTGFEKGGDVIGRPVDVVQGPDGAIYVSDDYAGAVYRIVWGNMKAAEMSGQIKDLTDVKAAFSPEQIAAGSNLFLRHDCAQCHVQASAPDGVQVKELRTLTKRFDQAAMSALLNAPPGPMPRPELTASERAALAAYLLVTY